MNPKHKGPHCDGLCEGQAYLIKIRGLEAELDVANKESEENLRRATELEAELAAKDKYIASMVEGAESLLIENRDLKLALNNERDAAFNRGLELAAKMVEMQPIHSDFVYQNENMAAKIRKEIK